MNIKRIILAGFSLMFCLSLQAQLEQGNYSITLGMEINPEFENSGVSFSLGEKTFEIGYFIKDKWGVGVSGNFQYGRSLLFRRANYNFGAFTKYYISDSEKFTPYVGAFVGGGRILSLSENALLNIRRPYLKVAAGVGTDYWFTNKFAATGGVRYSINEFFENSGINFNQLEINVGGKFNF